MKEAIPSDVLEYAAELTLLYVEDEILTRSITELRFSRLFKRFMVAVNGREGLDMALSEKPDLIMTDYLMPEMDGLEMVRLLRESGSRIPVVLVTSSIDDEVLSQAINLGVSKFISKPINFRTLRDVFRSVAQEIVSTKIFEQNRRQEVELLRYEKRYHSQQQEMAHNKEKHLLRNDMQWSSMVSDSAGSRWFMDISHRPLDIMCGDGFMVRRLANGDVLVFVIDAMGSGLSASMTSMCSTACLNFLFDLYEHEQRYDFGRLVKLFLSFSHTVLLKNEVLSCGFLNFHSDTSQVDAALFALPPLLVRHTDGRVTKIRGLNPPISLFLNEYESQQLDLAGIDSLLLCTDGLTDAETTDGRPYRINLPDDFSATYFGWELEQLFDGRVLGRNDDTTFIRINRIDAGSSYSEFFSVTEGINAANRALTWIESRCHTLNGELSETCLTEIITAATEIVMNAYEHGCLGLDTADKVQLMNDGGYEAFLAAAVSDDSSGFTVDISSKTVSADRTLLVLTVTDSGKGFNFLEYVLTSTSNSSPCGRGMRLIRKYADAMFYNQRGNSLCLLKYLY